MSRSTSVAIVTGAAGGIGRAIAARLAADAIAVVAVDRDAPALGSAVAELNAELNAGAEAGPHAGGARVIALAADVTDEALGARTIQTALAAFGAAPSILVNNAGAGSAQVPIWEIDPATWRRDLEVNLTSHFLLCRALAPVMIEAGYGRIVNIASAAGMEGQAYAGGYAAAKAGVVALTKTLGKELATTGVIVNAIAPALIATAMIESDWFSGDVKRRLLERIPMGRPGTPEEVAELVAYLASDRVTFSTGAVYDLSGGRATY